MDDVDTCLGWTRSVLSPPTISHAIDLVKAIVHSVLGNSDRDAMVQLMDVSQLKVVCERLDTTGMATPKATSLGPAQHRDDTNNIASAIRLLLREEAMLMVAVADKRELDGSSSSQSKFGELVMGEAETHFSGLTALRPNTKRRWRTCRAWRRESLSPTFQISENTDHWRTSWPQANTQSMKEKYSI